MGEVATICSICSGQAKPAYTCKLCGATVCDRCFTADKGVCNRCAANL